LLFYQSARALGVSELLLPVLVFGQGAVAADAEDEVARIIGTRQYVDLQAALIEGADSATWRRSMLEVANSLVNVVESAEAHLLEASARQERQFETPTSEALEQDEDSDGLSELSEGAEILGPKIVDLSQRYIAEIQAIGQVLRSATSGANGTTTKLDSKGLTLLASQLRPISERAGALGRDLESAVLEADSVLRQASDLLAREEWSTPDKAWLASF
jgi:hypothetical protein